MRRHHRADDRRRRKLRALTLRLQRLWLALDLLTVLSPPGHLQVLSADNCCKPSRLGVCRARRLCSSIGRWTSLNSVHRVDCNRSLNSCDRRRCCRISVRKLPRRRCCARLVLSRSPPLALRLRWRTLLSARLCRGVRQLPRLESRLLSRASCFGSAVSSSRFFLQVGAPTAGSC